MASREENSSETDLATSDMEVTSTSTSTSTSEVDLDSSYSSYSLTDEEDKDFSSQESSSLDDDIKFCITEDEYKSLRPEERKKFSTLSKQERESLSNSSEEKLHDVLTEEEYEALSETDKERYFNFYCNECRTDKGLSAYVPSRVHDKDGPAMEEEESRGQDKGVNIPVLFKCELPDGTFSENVTLKSKKQLFWAFKLCGRILGRPAESLGFLHHGETWLTPFDTPEEMNMKPGDVVTIQPDLVYLSKSTGEKK